MHNYDIYICIFFKFQEALEMVKPGMQLADKMPDAYIQLWAASLLRGKVQHGSSIRRYF